MIRIEKIAVKEFRGIRDFTLELKGDNFAVCGPNGTGKSGIVDAIQFALTGSISRLSGEGTKELSVIKHGPHVDSRATPNQAYVELTFVVAESGEKATIRRNVKDTRTPTVNPNHQGIMDALNHIERHPEFVLSRRELIRYVISKAGDRAKEVQALLKLDKLGALRLSFNRIHKKLANKADTLNSEFNRSKENLTNFLGITSASPTELLAEVNKRRAILSLAEIKVLDGKTLIRDGVATESGKDYSSKLPKLRATNELKSLDDCLNNISSIEFKDTCKLIESQIKALSADASLLDGLSRGDMLTTALKVFDENACPVCDAEWEPEKFRGLVNSKLEKLAKIQEKRSDLEKALEPIINDINNAHVALMSVFDYPSLLSKSIDIQKLEEYGNLLSEAKDHMRNFVPLDKTIGALSFDFTISEAASGALDAIKKATNEIPEPSQQDSAREYLILGQEKLETYRAAGHRLKKERTRSSIAEHISAKYVEVVDEELNKIYKGVEQTFRDFYRFINKDDESEFEARLTPSMGKLGFDVNFYGRGFFPPGAYHSEGHQDGMGLCLYLALMKYLLGEGFTFAVLDDVLMSVDSGHRREVCTLLKKEFPDTQFVLTTHDDIWLKHMKTAGLVKDNGFVHFRTWDVGIGPTEWSDRDIWDEIRAHLDKAEIVQAAALMRNFLEYFSKEVCHRLRALVIFRGDAQFTLRDLLPPAAKRLKNLLEDGRKAAESWGNQAEETKIRNLKNNFSAAVEKSEIEKWQINKGVHYDEWINLNKNDFISVVNCFEDLLKHFRCKKCNDVLHLLTAADGKNEMLKCNCSSYSINLRSKK